jgi:hypothetical protein
MSNPLPESLVHYLAARDAQHADDVRSILDALTLREQRLIMDAAVMGYVRGKMSGRDEPVPKNGAILAEVVGATLSFSDLYPVLTGVRPCGECDHPEYAHGDGDEEEGTQDICLQCKNDGADNATHGYRLKRRP